MIISFASGEIINFGACDEDIVGGKKYDRKSR
jgi:hypothetical protein